jgi:NADH:ubiquinone oxidoreductase subunit 4 (subunit M)
LVALVTALATLGVGFFTLTQFDFDQAGKLQFFAETEWIKVISSNYTIGLDGMSLPLYFLSMVVTVLVMVYSVEPYSLAWKCQSVLDLDADSADRHGRNIRGSRLDLVLRVL